MTSPRLGYVVRFVAALGPAVDFYEGVLGQRLSKRTDHWAQFDCGEVRLGLYERAAMTAALGVDDAALGQPPGALELAFEVLDCDAAFAAAVAGGARAFREPADRAWGERTAYVLDPDGALVELYTREDTAERLGAGARRPRDRGAHEARSEMRRGAEEAQAQRSTEMGSPSSESTTSVSDPNA